MTPLPELTRADAARIALLHSLSPSQQRELARLVAVGACNLPVDGVRLGQMGLRFRARKQDHVASLPSDREIDEALDIWDAKGWRFLTAHDERFPNELGEIPDPPLHLFASGKLGLLRDGRPRVAIVGSRAASPSGIRIAREFSRDLALAGCVVVSGLARGIDTAAHRGALDAGGDTLAVLGTGLDRIYPREHAAMAEEITEQGLLVTEFAPGTPPLPLHFPRRNRVLTGLADALVVVEGGERSGARSSLDHALDQGREVFAVPRDPLHEGSRLPNRMLRDGAAVATSARDLLEFIDRIPRLGGRVSPRRLESSLLLSAGPAAVPIEKRVRAAVERLPGRSLEALSEELHPVGPRELLGALTTLELEGRLRRIPGGRWYPTDPSRAQA